MQESPPVAMPLETLQLSVARIFEAAGVDPSDAQVVADVLVGAESRGVESQGLLRLGRYLDSWFAGAVQSPAQIQLKADHGGSLVFESNRAWPQVALLHAGNRAVERARELGSCTALVVGTGHIGRLGHYIERIAQQGMIGLVLTGGDGAGGWVAPWGSTTPAWGTNPIAFAFPRADGADIVVDISTTQTSRGRILLAQANGETLPADCAFDADGHPTQDPHSALPPGGTMAPLGGLSAGHKGYGLALAVEILTGVLGGPQPADAGSTFISVFNPDAFTSRGDYEKRLSELAERIKSGVPREGYEIRLPGEGADGRLDTNIRDGLVLSGQAWSELQRAGTRVGISIEGLQAIEPTAE